MTSIIITNLFNLRYDQINTMKKKILLNHIENLKGKVTKGAIIKKICNKISQKRKMKNLVENLCICKEAGIGLKLFDIEGCHRLPSGCINTSSNGCVIVKSMNSKNSEAMRCVKESISSCSNVFATNSLCPYYHFLLGKCKNLQRKSSPLKKEKMALQLRSFLKVTYWFTY